ncbi:hypothetical protein GOP47_0002454 [Adiantum capillus-veneris]|uniref:Uncharacterized protein n=1 Tax=Adiantum capillus-veneris TaxID=13818 RepID=A0A9D4VA48_ADICA|nr:hypothetical protein GOP47_0002454 [Adiantum capillus-veneris]
MEMEADKSSWSGEDWDKYMNVTEKEMEEELEAFFLHRRPICMAYETDGVLTRAKRAKLGKQLEGRCYGVDKWVLKGANKEESKVMNEWSARVPKNDWKHPGHFKNITEGNYKGWLCYKCLDLKEIPETLHYEGSGEVVEEKKAIYQKNRRAWFEEGKFEIIMERKSFSLDLEIEQVARQLVDEVYLNEQFEMEETESKK